MNGLERVTVLVVEDNLQIRNLIVSVLQRVGVGHILRASEGMEAINMMKEMQHNPTKIGVGEVDLIISDWEMEPVDGGTLLRWVRRHKESPDKFLPFFLLTGHAEEDRVTMARDLGVTEFITKPFSVDVVIAHIQAAVRDTRRYVMANGYFGPDRRRREENVANDRRSPKGEGAKFFEPPRRLFGKAGGELTIDQSTVDAAMQDVADMHDEFGEWITQDLGKLDRAFVAAKDMSVAEKRIAPVRSMSAICHELRGQGGVFGYPLISVVAESLYKFSNNIVAVPDDGLKLVRTHLDMMKAILREEITGEGGDLGPQLMNSLKIANYNFISKEENESLVAREFAQQARIGAQQVAESTAAMD